MSKLPQDLVGNTRWGITWRHSVTFDLGNVPFTDAHFGSKELLGHLTLLGAPGPSVVRLPKPFYISPKCFQSGLSWLRIPRLMFNMWHD